jgi:hypothetical protein
VIMLKVSAARAVAVTGAPLEHPSSRRDPVG